MTSDEDVVTTFADAQGATLPAVTGEIIEMIAAEMPLNNLTAESSLLEGGLDSLRVMSLVLRIESRWHIELDADDADDLRTVGDLARLVLRRIEARP